MRGKVAYRQFYFILRFGKVDSGYFGRGLLGSWPQADIGVVLWSLSVSAGEWQASEKLTRLCTIPEPDILSRTWGEVGLRHGGAVSVPGADPGGTRR